MLNMINQYASVCILNKKDVPSHNQNESETLMEGKKKINNNGYDYVDLELPSGTLWATCNVGASKPSEYGLLFQWGDTQGYTADQVGTGDGKKRFALDWSDYKWGETPNFTKYKTYGAMLELEDDAARANMGGDWHMPTPKQIQELLDNTTSAWTTLDDISGMAFTSKKDTSKSIFIPAVGYAWDGSVLYDGSYGSIWTSMLNMDGVGNGQLLGFGLDSVILFCHGGRFEGLSIRGVIG